MGSWRRAGAGIGSDYEHRRQVFLLHSRPDFLVVPTAPALPPQACAWLGCNRIATASSPMDWSSRMIFSRPPTHIRELENAA